MKKIKSFSVILLCVFLVCTAFCSCGEKKEKFTAYSFDFFDTATTIVGYEKHKEDFDRVSSEILSQLSEYHRLYDIYHRYDGMENLCTINELSDGAHRVVTVDMRIIDMLLFAKEMYGKTNGKVNVALGSVLSIWHNCRTAGLDEPKDAVLPDIRALSEASKHTDINSIIIDAEASTVYISDPMTTLDVGAVAKGYAVEMVARSLEERGISGYVINVGGNVRTIGTKPDGEKWLTGIENPDTDSDVPYRKYLELSGEAIVTSGSYQRYYTVEGKNYHHIIDPDTLFPAEGYLSVSVVSDSSALGDALSTALFCMPHEDGLALVEALENTEAMWVLSDGTEIMSGGFSRFVSNR